MKKDIIITIGREFGSGGREIGVKLAEKLGIKFFDKELITSVAEKMQCGEGAVEFYEEKAPGFLYTANSIFDIYEMPMSDKIFIAQSHAIEELAEKERPCIVIGRAADYVLKEHENVFRVFIKSDIKNRVERKKHIVENVVPEKMEAHIKSVDKRRAKYYSYYTDQKWGVAATYDLCVDSGVFGIDGAVELIANAIKIREESL